MKQVSRPQAVQIIQTVAQQYGIADPFETYDDALINIHVNAANTPSPYRKKHNPTASFICLVESEFGVDPGDPHDIREYEMYLRD
jgi:hypothetical protein